MARNFGWISILTKNCFMLWKNVSRFLNDIYLFKTWLAQIWCFNELSFQYEHCADTLKIRKRNHFFFRCDWKAERKNRERAEAAAAAEGGVQLNVYAVTPNLCITRTWHCSLSEAHSSSTQTMHIQVWRLEDCMFRLVSCFVSHFVYKWLTITYSTPSRFPNAEHFPNR